LSAKITKAFLKDFSLCLNCFYLSLPQNRHPLCSPLIFSGIIGESDLREKAMNRKQKKSLWKWLVASVVLIFFAFMALLPFCWEEGDDVPAPNPVIEGG
jgi:hypothetical protein